MKNLNTFIIGALMVRPFDPSSKLAHDKKLTDQFDMRSHFILFSKQTHVAVLVHLLNDNTLSRRSPANNFILEVFFQNSTSGEIIALKTIQDTMKSSDFIKSYRIDLPVSAKEIDETEEYAVVIRDSGTGLELSRREIRFFSLAAMKKLPTRMFLAEEAYLNPEYPWKTEKIRSIGATDRRHITATFHLRICKELIGRAIPEITVRTVAPDGKEEYSVVSPERYQDSLFFDIPDSSERFVANHNISLDPKNTGIYYVELQCMGYAFSGFLFSTEGSTHTGSWTDDALGSHRDYNPEEGRRRFEKLIESIEIEQQDKSGIDSDSVCVEESSLGILDELVGLTSVKAKVRQYTCLMRFNRLRRNASLPDLPLPLHCMFLGSPGTGKTTVARIIGSEMKAIGALSKGHVVVRERSTLIGKYYNSEAEKTLEAIEEAQGGILFIDEAYQLCQPDDPKDPGRFVIETLMTTLADESKRDWMLILAGYAKPTLQLFDINPGLRSRIPESNIYVFEDFNEEELFRIGKEYLEKNRFEFGEGAIEKFRLRLAADYAARDETFGNARHVINLIQTEIIPSMAMRAATSARPGKDELSIILPCDIPLTARRTSKGYRSVGFAV